MSHKKLWHGLTYTSALVLAVTITASIVLEQFSSNVDDVLGTQSELLVSEDDGSTYSTYTPDEAYLNADGTGNSHALIEDAIDIGRQEGAEGSVLLKNNGVLPLTSSESNKTKVTLLGLRSHMPLLGSGMGVKVQGPMITLEDALSRDTTDWTNEDKWVSNYSSTMDVFEFGGADYELNPTTIAYYDSWNKSLATPVTYNDSVSSYTSNGIREPEASDVEANCASSFASYNDAAIVVIGRPGSESSDYLPGQVSDDGVSQPLELTPEETGIIELAEQNFDKVIVLINSCNSLNIDDLKHDEKVDAILNISFPGAYGMAGVADILSGKTSPSGGLADIDAADQMSAPAMMNMGDYTFSNADQLTRSRSANYVIEAENIYTGYRYYETRYNDVVEGRGNANSTIGTYASTSSWNYEEEVSYGFGYGLSYTSFDQEIVSARVNQEAHEITIDFDVKVTNTGDVAGKSIVQIYGQAPYTDGGIEKSAIQLLNFDKTITLDSGESETVSVTVDLQNLASYDSSVDNGDGTYGTYVFDAGDYYFALGNGAHDALNNVLDAQGHTTAEGMDYEGNSDLVWEWEFTPANGSDRDVETFSVSKNDTRVSNQLEYADWNYYDENDSVTQLSRSDWSGTYPKEYVDMEIPDSMFDDLNGYYYTVKTDEDTSEFVWGSTDTDWKFYQMTGADWDDYRWEEILGQMTINESMYLAGFGGPTFPAVPSIGFEEMSLTENNGNGIVYTLSNTKDPNAPWAITESDNNSEWNGQVFGASPLLAASFNPDLFLRRGEFVGNESLFLGVPIIWGPGLNTHRQNYNGRNCEYYSEDPILCGVIAMEFSYGCDEYGLVAAPKHFAFNDQETNRNGVAPFMTEQRAREVELRAYQIAIEAPKYEGFGMYGLMTSFSKIGAVECTCSRGLLTSILKEEWGFHGYAVTDIYDDTDLYTCMVYAGATGYDLRGAQGFDSTNSLNANSRFADGTQADGLSLNENTYAGDATMQQALKDSNKNLLWAFAQSNLMNRYSASTHVESQMTWWRIAYITAIVVFSLITAGLLVLYILSLRKENN